MPGRGSIGALAWGTIGLVCAGSVAAGADASLRTRVTTSPRAIVTDLDAGDVEKALAEQIDEREGLALAAADEAADLTVEIVKATRVQHRRLETSARQGPVKVPGGDTQRPFGADGELGARTTTIVRVTLEVRLASKDRFVTVSSSPDDDSLSRATASVARGIERAVEQHRAWFLGE